MNTSFSNLVILIPSFNPNQKLLTLVMELSQLKWNEIIIINDGSSNESLQFFDKLKNINNVRVITHAVNLGKGAALKTGIKIKK